MENARRQEEKAAVEADSCVNAHWVLTPLTPYARYIGGFRFYPPLTETSEPPPKHGRETPNKTPVRNKICSGANQRSKIRFKLKIRIVLRTYTYW